MRDLHAFPPFLDPLVPQSGSHQWRGMFAPPEQLTPLFGRDDDLRSVLNLITSDHARLVTLTGAPGVGKTRLALAICGEWQLATGDEVFFVPLTALSDAALVLPTIAHGLNVQPEGDVPLVERVAATIGTHSALMVLDNFEQVVTAASDVIDLLTHCPSLTIVVTSRAALRVRGEYEWHVLPLKLPDIVEVDQLTILALNPAVALLLDRARAHHSDLVLTKANAPAIAGICVRLEGIPLAIELAAAWLKLFSPQMLVDRLAQDLELLREGARDLPERQRTLSGAIAWSDHLLEPDEQHLFHTLAVFSDGWSLDAAQDVCGVNGPYGDEHQLLDGLSALLDKSLIQRRIAVDGAPRFRMLELIRQYASRQLDAIPTAVDFHDRHAYFYLSFVERAVPHLYSFAQAAWMEQLENELANLRSALRWLIDRSQKMQALHFAAELENFWLVHDHLGEGQRWLEEALSLDGTTHPREEAAARRALASLMLRRGEYARARELHTRNLTFALDTGNEVLRRQTLLDLGTVSFVSGDLEQARADFRQALSLSRDVADWRNVARALNQLGEIARFAGNEMLAAQRYEESLAIWRELTDKDRIAMVLHNLAPVTARIGDTGSAIELFAESLAISWELHSTHGVAICVFCIAGMIDTERSRLVTAARLLGAAEALRATIGVHWQPVDRTEYERSVAVVRRQLDDETFRIAWVEGRGLSLEATVDSAMSLLKAIQTRPDKVATRSYRRNRVPGGLSRREYEVVTQIALGLTNREIAAALSVSEKTIEMHVSHCLSKLHVRSRTQLAAWISSQPSPAETPSESCT